MNMLIDRTHIPLLRKFEIKWDPMVKMCPLHVPPPSLVDSTGDIDRILSALREKLTANGGAVEKIEIPLGLLQRTSGFLRACSFRAIAVVAQQECGLELIDLREGDECTCYGLAIDIGTTIISFYLVDLIDGEVVAKTAAENPQVSHGEDILSRIHFCRTEIGLPVLRGLLIECINKTTAQLAQAAGIVLANIYAASVAGNPTMMHLLLGVDPYFLCREPYAPAFNLPLQYKAHQIGMSIFPDAPVYLFPNCGSYFGGDVVAGILASGIYRSDDVSILVDVGTNAEIVLGNRDWLAVCAGAAGPALESGGAKAGMRALAGAIEKVRIDRETLEPAYSVIGDGRPKGVCGSGLIDVVAGLYLTGLLDSNGRLSDSHQSRRRREKDGVRSYALALAELGESEQDIAVDELDIRSLLRAKGAMYTALTLITERLGVSFRQLSRFFVAGSFGEHIDPRSAVSIGMLPDIPLDRFKTIGNSAGLGACMMLVSSSLRKAVDDIRQKATYIQLTTDGEFMNRLSAALFIPHTQKELFPSVKRRDI